MSKKFNPLESKKFYKVKNPKKNFLCALCSAPRSLKYSNKLNSKQFLQILLISISITYLSFPVIGEKSVFAIFLVWPVFDLINKFLYRKEIPCPYCGFDATWYRRDVNKANDLVKQFWLKNYPELVEKDITPDLEQIEPMEIASEPEASSQESIN